MKVLVCGNRHWDNINSIMSELEILTFTDGDNFLITGGCSGADYMAECITRNTDLSDFWTIKVFHADWDKHGKSAGPIRNREMLDMEPDIVLAFHGDLSKSKGTKDCVFEANRRGIRVVLIPE